jgi:hypothetical protein
MKTRFFYLLFTLLTFSSFGQVTFEKGYFINNENQRIECLIKNYDQKNSPKGIEYKIDENSEYQKADIAVIKEFGIINDSKFIRAETNIDRSSNDLAKPSENGIPVWSHEQLFLKVLVEGKASLFSYHDKATSRFFYSVSDSYVKQLIYKEYLSEDRKYLLTNNGFRQQLWTDIKCENAATNSVENISYSESALKKYFNRYNECNGIASKEYKIKEKKNAFHLKMTSGFTLTSASFSITTIPYSDTYFEKDINYRLGIDMEYTLPFNKNKWRIAFEPSYQHYSSQAENTLGDAEIIAQSIEFPLGIRYYFFLNDNLNIYLNVLSSVTAGINFNSAITIDYPYSVPIYLENQSCLSLGIGANYKRLSSEIRIYANRNIIGHDSYESDYRVSAFIIGYRIF